MMKIWLSVSLSVACVCLPGQAFSACKGTSAPTEERVARVHKLVAGGTPENTFHLLSEANATNDKIQFALFALDDSDPMNAPGVYLAATSTKAPEKILFLHDVSAYLPKLKPEKPAVGPRTKSQIPASPERETPKIDGCLNTFSLPDDMQGVDLNLFLEASRAGVSGANDVLLAVPEDGFIEPVLKMNETSILRTRAGRNLMHQDSTIWLRKEDGVVTEVIWEQFTSGGGTILAASYFQNLTYRWGDKGFHRTGTRTPEQLDLLLKDATALTRCDSIVPLRLEKKLPTANAPAP